jgi:hypothetical protein
VRNVFLLDTKRWVSESVGKIAIIGQQQQTFGVHIKSPDGKDPRHFWNEFEDCGSTLGIVCCRHHTDWLVKKKVHQTWSNTNDDSVDGNLIDIDMNPTTELGDFAVHGHCTVSNEVLADPATTDSDTSENLLKPLP